MTVQGSSETYRTFGVTDISVFFQVKSEKEIKKQINGIFV